MAKATKSAKMNDVLEVITTNKQCTAKTICDTLGLDSREVSGILKKLRGRGLIRIVESSSSPGNVWGLN